MTDLNTIFIDEKDIAHLHLDLKRSCDELKVKGDIFLDHTIPCFFYFGHNFSSFLTYSFSIIQNIFLCSQYSYSNYILYSIPFLYTNK